MLQQCITSMQALLGFGGSSKSEAMLSAERAILAAELHVMQDGFGKLAADGVLNQSSFLELLGLRGLPPVLADGLWTAARHPGATDAPGINLEQLTIAKWQCLYDGDASAGAFCFRMLSPDAKGGVTWSNFAEALTAVAEWGSGAPPQHDIIQTVVEGAKAVAADDAAGDKQLSLPVFRLWSKSMPAPLQTMRSLLAAGSSGSSSSSATGNSSAALLPQLDPLKGLHLESCLLRPEWTWLLSASTFLPQKSCKQWRLLYSSLKQGKSFSTFMGRCSDQGPTLTLIKDKGGHVFGGFASASWERNGQFYGDFDSFVFSLLPSLAIYRASGANQNFQYCGQSFTQLPNGFGMGGQMGHFGLFVDDGLDTGMSRDAATYKSPTLSSQPLFEVESLECWAVDPPDPEKEAEAARLAAKRKGGGSVLDKRKEDKMLMQMAGRKMEHAER